ncbi:MAG: FAD-dependent oxidoreductase [Gammaproteobacteria bacterium]|nr:FAD-dependent oxidoreductase [Gammaproteobacteria bacterium]
MPPIVVVGAGQAGLQVVDSLRRGGYTDALTLIGDETWLPYQRPPLSKKFLLEEMDPARLYFRPAAHFSKQDVTLRLGVSVTRLNRTTCELTLSDGSTVHYDRLALATGTRVRTLPVPGADDPRVCYLRGLDDAVRVKARLVETSRVVIVGAGFIGLEIAAVARALGKEVTVIEAQGRVMPRVVAPLVSAYFQRVHESHGVRVMTDAQVQAVVNSGAGLAVRLRDATEIPAELIIVGIGVVPNTELAAAAGIICDSGIVVDEFARTNDPAIVAAGDCTRHRNTLFAEPHRLESVQNAVDQAKVAAASLLDVPVAYAQVPWFWSDQYDVKLQMTGISTGYDELVLRGVPESGAFSVFYYAGERLLAVDSINRPVDHMVARRWLLAGTKIAKHSAADVAVDLKSVI